jgi:hypothetical protein
MRKLLIAAYIFIQISLNAQMKYQTQPIEPNIKTLQVGILGEKMSLPLLSLNGTEVLNIGFDEMSHQAHTYSYRVLHCNSDWTRSNLNTNEYIAGFTTGDITGSRLSMNTSILYTHYNFNLPNENMSFKISGNYVALVYEDNRQDKPILQACFSISEPRVGISANVRGNTDTELNGKLQQIDFDINLNGYRVTDVNTEIKVIVRQNNRTDNEITQLTPTYISDSKLSYLNNKELIFEGGNEYHRFDISSVYAASEGVDAIKFERPSYHAYLTPNKIRKTNSYTQDFDVNGRYIVNLQNSEDDDVDADYMFVHFNLPSPQPYFDGQLYLGGEFNYNLLNNSARLEYDGSSGNYLKTMLLKQGGYNYQYWFKSKGERKASAERVEGSYWQARNEYSIYVYHRAFGERYDRLIGVKTIEK